MQGGARSILDFGRLLGLESMLNDAGGLTSRDNRLPVNVNRRCTCVMRPRVRVAKDASLTSTPRWPSSLNASRRSVGRGPYTAAIAFVAPTSMYAEPAAWLTVPVRRTACIQFQLRVGHWSPHCRQQTIVQPGDQTLHSVRQRRGFACTKGSEILCALDSQMGRNCSRPRPSVRLSPTGAASTGCCGRYGVDADS